MNGDLGGSSSVLLTTLGLTLLHFLWQGAALGLLAWALVSMLGRATPAARYVTLVAVFVLMALCPVVTFVHVSGGLGEVPDGSFIESPSLTAVEPVHDRGGSGVLPSDAPDRADHGGPAAAIGRASRISDETAALESDGATSYAADPRDLSTLWRARLHAVASWLEEHVLWIVAGWLAGVLVLSARLLAAWIGVGRLRRGSVPGVSEELEKEVARLAARLGIRRPVRLLQSTLEGVPTVFGWLRPVILLPVGTLAGLTPRELEGILAHELAHIRRHDYLVNFIQRVFETLLFYHPAVWWLSRRIRIEREQCCDDLAAAACGDPVVYARALISLAACASSRQALGLAATGGGLFQRIHRLLRLPGGGLRDDPRSMGAVSVFLAGVVLTTGFLLAGELLDHQADNALADARVVRALDLTVIESGTGKPVSGVTLGMWASDAVYEERTTDSAGFARILLPPVELAPLFLTTRKVEFVPARASWRGDEAIGSHRLEVERARPIGGILRDPEDRPVVGATVAITVPGENVYLLSHRVRTDSLGHWRCVAVPAEPGSVHVEITHPAYADLQFKADAEDAIAELQSLKRVWNLTKGLPIRGTVVDESGLPIEGASVIQGKVIFQSPDGTRYGRRVVVKTDAEGRFLFENAAEGESLLTVVAAGYAPDLRPVRVSSKGAEVKFALSEGRTIRGRVVDGTGKPVSSADVSVADWRAERTLEWKGTTDADGRFEWRHAPDDRVSLKASKRDYQRVTVTVRPAESDITVTLQPRLELTGNVYDAETGAAIQGFKVVRGAAEGQALPRWDHEGAATFGGGRYVVAFSRPRAASFLRVEAPGYLPAESRAFGSDEGAQRLDFRLERGAGFAARVVDGAGGPVAGARVVLLGPADTLRIENGEPVETEGLETMVTGADGRFAIGPREERFTVALFHEVGYAIVEMTRTEPTRTIALEPWSTLEGDVRPGGTPVASEEVRVEYRGRPTAGLFRGFPVPVRATYGATTDSEGRFKVTRLLPGAATVSRMVTVVDGRTRDVREASHKLEIDIRPGATSSVLIGATGRPVVGRVTADAESTSEPTWSNAYAKLYEKAERTSAGRREYAARLSADGSFRVDSVEPGLYVLEVRLLGSRSVQRGYRSEEVGYVSGEVLVPADGLDTAHPIDAGSLSMKVHRELAEGQPAPPFSVATLDGGKLKLEDYRGKVVLVNFWASWCGPCTFVTRERLKPLQERFAHDDRFVMLGLTVDESLEDARRYVEKEKVAWPQGFLAGWASPVRAEYGVASIPSMFLIGPDGRILAMGLSVGEPSVLKALALQGAGTTSPALEGESASVQEGGR